MIHSKNELQKQMVTDIQSCGGAAVFERVNPTELGPNGRNARIEQFKADIVRKCHQRHRLFAG